MISRNLLTMQEMSTKSELNYRVYRTKKTLRNTTKALREIRKTKHACINAGYLMYYPELIKKEYTLTIRKHILKSAIFVLKSKKVNHD